MSDVSDYRSLVLKELDQRCWVEGCEREPIRIRHWPNPRWGFDTDGSTVLNSEADFLTDVRTLLTEPDTKVGFSLSAVRSYCKAHYPAEAAHSSTKPERTGAGSFAELRTLKSDAMQAYGGQCANCGETDGTYLVLCLSDEMSQTAQWSELGVTNWPAKWKWLKDSGYPEGLCTVRCFTCRSGRLAAVRTSKAISLRARIIKGYGSKCISCGSGKADELWLVRSPGEPILRWGGSGRKLTSRQKYQKLLAAGCPDTHVLLCPGCWKASRVGAGNGYLSD